MIGCTNANFKDISGCWEYTSLQTGKAKVCFDSDTTCTVYSYGFQFTQYLKYNQVGNKILLSDESGTISWKLVSAITDSTVNMDINGENVRMTKVFK